MPRSAPAAFPAVSVWASAQAAPRTQRSQHYTPDSTAHPAKMLPAIAAHAIRHYTRPGDLVIDPMCGIGTTLIEACTQGRHALGVDYEHHWVHTTQANLDALPGPCGTGRVLRGDARQLPALLPDDILGQAALVVTSPPYGPSVHGRIDHSGGRISKYHHRYGNVLDRGNLANIGHHRLLAGFTRILTGCTHALRPGGHVVVTVRPWREHAELIDLPSQIAACGTQAGLRLVDRCAALLGRTTTPNEFIARGSFFQRNNIAKQRATGIPLHLISHEDVLVFQNPLNPGNPPSRAESQADSERSSIVLGGW